MKQQMKNNKAITLISLVVTIILLLILASVTLSLVLGENGLLATAKRGTEQYQYEGIKEKIESEILALDIEKVVKGETLTIEDALISLQEKGTFEETDLETRTGICEGYVIELGYNEEGKVVILGIQKDTGVRIVAKLNPTGYTNGKVEVSILTSTNKQKITSIEVPEGMNQKEGTKEEDHIYEVASNGTYQVTATLEDGNTIEKDITIATIDRLPPKEFTIKAENTGSGIIITAQTEDADANTANVKSGIDRYEYYIKKTTEADTAYKKYDTNEINNLEMEKYSVYVIAYDKAGNDRSSSVIEIEVKEKLKFEQIAAGDYHNLGIDIRGNLWTWGRNTSGQLGDGTTTDKNILIKITITAEPNKKWKQVSGGGNHSLAIDEEGNLWAWGYNYNGQLGDGTTDTTKNIPTKITIVAERNKKWKQVSAGDDHSLAIDEEGNLWTWGYNTFGQLGDETKTKKNVPTKITIATEPNKKWKEVSAGGEYSLAIDEEGNLWTWGRNASGQLGDGTTRDKNVPTKIIIATEPNKKWEQVSAGKFHSLAIDEEGNLWAWGWNNFGQLGDGTNTDKNVPSKITIAAEPNKKWEQVSAGLNYSLAIDEEGNLWAWGWNDFGQLGDGTNTNKNVPTKITIVAEPNKKWKQVVVGYNHSLVISEEGNLWTWGNNQYGQLGDGTKTKKNVPTPITQ